MKIILTQLKWTSIPQYVKEVQHCSGALNTKSTEGQRAFMRRLIVLFYFLFIMLEVQSQTTTPGYYITQQDDTVKTNIRIRKGVFGQTSNDFIKEVEVIDSVKGSNMFTPDDIKGYGFSYEGKRYLFVSKPVKNASNKFLSPLYIGPRSSLYLYGIYSSGSGSSLPSQQVFYTFEKSDGSFLFLRNILNNKFRTQVKEFYKDNREVQAIIDSKLRYWLDLNKDLLAILVAANME